MKIGNFEVNIISDGTFKLDGGGMYGIVPKALWEKRTPADAQNRITLGMNCLLVQTGKKNYLIETGIGSGYTEKFKSIYDIHGGNRLIPGLAKLGVIPEEIHGVIVTHLHFDHAGGCTICGVDGKPVPAFPKAKYFIQKQEWHDAMHPNELTDGSYLDEKFLPIKSRKSLELIKGDAKIDKGIQVQLTGGHTKGHQIVWIESEGKKACFLGDFIPTTNHLKLAWVMAYDSYPIELVNLKRSILAKLVEEKCYCFWYHDPNIAVSCLGLDTKGNAVVKAI